MNNSDMYLVSESSNINSEVSVPSSDSNEQRKENRVAVSHQVNNALTEA